MNYNTAYSNSDTIEKETFVGAQKWLDSNRFQIL